MFTKIPTCLRSSVLLASLAALAPAAFAITDPPGGVLSTEVERYRVIVSTDIGGGDFDDDQSMVHLLQYSDVLEIEGLIGSRPTGEKADIDEVIAKYEQDYAKMLTHSPNYPTPAYLRGVSKQGATSTFPASATDGSNLIISAALKQDPRPVYILVWGALTDVARAVQDNPSIKNKIRVVCISGSSGYNHNGDPAAWNYLFNNHANLWLINSNSSFRGMYETGWNTGPYGNIVFIFGDSNDPASCVGHGALGNYMTEIPEYGTQQKRIKAGDSPSVLYMLRGNPADPAAEHWGGRYYKPDPTNRPNYWTDLTDSTWALVTGSATYNGAKTVSQYRDNFMSHWASRMDRCQASNAGNRPPTVSITNPLTGATFTGGSNIAIAANASDPDGTISKVEFYNGNTLLGTDTSSPYQFTWNAVPQGLYSIRAKAYDNSGAATVSPAPVIVNVTGGSSNTPPSVSITSPADGATFTQGANIAINATASDSNGTVTQVEFFHGSTSLGVDMTSPYSVTWNSVPAGTYVLTAAATDNNNATTTSTAKTITVTSSSGAVVTINSVSNGKAYATATAATGVLEFIDRTYTISAMSAGLAGSTIVGTACDDKTLTNTNHLSLQLHAAATVYVVYDTRLAPRATWLDASWTASSETITTSDGAPWQIYAKSFSAGQLWLGGNQTGSAAPTTSCANYFVLVKASAAPGASISVVSVSNGKAYTAVSGTAGATFYIDRTYTITALSSGLANGTLIKTANDDKFLNVASHLTLNASGQVTLYLAYDERATTLPSWLSSWTPSSETISTSLSTGFNIYSKVYPAGNIVLPSNANGGAVGQDAHYFIIAK